MRALLDTHSFLLLPFHHNDPFDRLLVAQSMIENLPILTIDAIIAQYGAQTIW